MNERPIQLLIFRTDSNFDGYTPTFVHLPYTPYREKDLAFVFDILKLPVPLLTIWKGNMMQGWEYPIEFQLHVAETYFKQYIPPCAHEWVRQIESDLEICYKCETHRFKGRDCHHSWKLLPGHLQTCEKCHYIRKQIITPHSMADVEQQWEMEP